MNIAAIGDIHISTQHPGRFSELFKSISEVAEVLILAGDLTDSGEPEDAEELLRELEVCTIPVVGVLGNHDYERGNEHAITTIVSKRMTVLDGTSTVVGNVGFAGIKGFAGGFDTHVLTPFGEKAIKTFVQEAVNDTLRLEQSLAQLDTEKKVVVLHYAPIRATVIGESPEIFPFLGCTRLVEPINRFGALSVFHGHAHHGTFEGKTETGIPVYNVASPLLQGLFPDKPYCLTTV